jgi:hypothetical protein
MSHDAPPSLLQVWLHSPNEDTKDSHVYRPRDLNQSPGRARRGFELRGNGDFVNIEVGQTDASTGSEGKWRLVAPNVIEVSHGSSDRPARVMRIVSHSPDRLEIKK